jgi:NAD(P)-dependent dehydrogenase (short-subunit alcohol dehydrogenase family)
VITGAAKGIGYETARTFINEGAEVVVSDLDVAQGETASKRLGRSCSFIAQDVTNELSWDKLADHINSNYGRIDILVNNAGILGTETTQNIETTTLAQWRTVHT